MSQHEAQTPTSVQLTQLLAVTHGRVKNQKTVFTNKWHLGEAAPATRQGNNMYVLLLWMDITEGDHLCGRVHVD